MSLTEFGFQDGNNFPMIPAFEKTKEHQTDLKELDIIFVCPISKIQYMNKIEHSQKCQYRYCKKGWTFR